MDFINANFGVGINSFEFVTFGDGITNFGKTAFVSGSVSFKGIDFSNKYVKFVGTDFGECDISFTDIVLSDDGLGLEHAKINGRVDFSDIKSNTGYLIFEDLDFGNSVKLNKLSSGGLRGVSFKHSNFMKSLDISGNFPFIPDLTYTNIEHQVDFHNFQYRLNRTSNWKTLWLIKVAENREDEAKLTRLKELAESNKDYTATLKFHADEMR